MKTSKSILLVGVSALMMLTSCSKEDNMPIPEGSQTSTFTLVASQNNFLPNIQTKTTIDRWYAGSETDPSVKAGVAMKWTKDDAIGIFGTDPGLHFIVEIRPKREINGDKLTSSSAEPSYSTTFSTTANGAADWTIDAAYYPHNANNTDKTKIAATIPTTQNYTDVNSLAAYDHKAAVKFNQGANGENLTTTFQQMGTLLRFVIKDAEIVKAISDKGNTIANDAKVTSITFSSSNKNLTGDFTYDLTNLTAGLVKAAKGKVSKKLIINCNGRTQENGSDVVYAIVAPTSSTVLSCSFVIGNYTVSLKNTPPSELTAAKVYNIGLNAKSMGDATITKNSKSYIPSGETNGNEFSGGEPAI